MSVFSYSFSNFSKVQNTLSGRKVMMLEDKSLLRKKFQILITKLSLWTYFAENILQTS